MRALRIIVLLLVVLLAGLMYKLWFGHGGAGDVRALSQKVELQKRENSGLKQRNDALAAEVENLKSADGGAAVEERARSELGMIKPGEVFYRVVEDRPAEPAPEAGDPKQETSP